MKRPWINVSAGNRKRRGRRQPLTRILSAQDRARRGAAAFDFKDVSRDRWEQAFGPYDPEKFRRALAEQRAGKAAVQRPRAAAVHGDNKGAGRRLYNGFDFGLGEYIHGRSDRRRCMAEAGLREAH